MTPNDGLSRLPSTALWFEATAPRPPLDRDVDVDVAIVGAGYTGLWTAYYLLKADPALRVALVEREHVGFGASGRNGGWASAIFPISLRQLAKLSSHAVTLQQPLAAGLALAAGDRAQRVEAAGDGRQEALLGLTLVEIGRNSGGCAWLVRWVRPRPWMAASAFQPASSR